MKSITVFLPLLPILATATTTYQQICTIDPTIERYFPVGQVEGDRVMASRRSDLPNSSTAAAKVPLYRCICQHPDFRDSRTTQSYCPKKNACGIPIGNDPVQCFETEVMNGVARLAWPIFILTSFVLCLVMVVSFYGLAIGKYLRKLFMSKEDRATLETAEVDELWQIDRQAVGAPSWVQFFSFQRYQYQSTILKQARIQWQHEWKKFILTAPPPTLSLPTKRFVAAVSSLDHDDDTNDDQGSDANEVMCSICFAPLEEGDKIGDLRCRHEFHADCLKTWLVRRNTCPLCQARDIAHCGRDRCQTEQLPVTSYQRPDEERQLLDGEDMA